MNKLPLRARLATTVGGAASKVSRMAGRGDGSVIGGVIGLRLEPGLLSLLAQDRQVVLVTGTNGKTTTTRLVTAALAPLGQKVASNAFGANMEAGMASALGQAPDATIAVLECDEKYIPAVLKATSARVVVLLNLSRDQMDRAAEIWLLARRWRDALAAAPDCHVVANADDPLIVWSASRAANVTWVAGGQRWHDDSWCCPQCGSHLRRADEDWKCGECSFARPPVRWALDGEDVIDSAGRGQPVQRRGRPGRCRGVRRGRGARAAWTARRRLGGGPLHDRAAARRGGPAAAGQEPGRLAGGPGRAAATAGAGDAGGQIGRA